MNLKLFEGLRVRSGYFFSTQNFIMVHFTIFNKRIRYSFNVAFRPKLILQIALILSLALFFVGGGEESLDLLTHVLSLLPVH